MRKFLLSAFVVLTFAFYSIHKHFESAATSGTILRPSNLAALVSQSPSPAPAGDSPLNTPGKTPSANPTPASSPAKNSLYKDGQYTGDSVDAYYGNIQVAVSISGGKIVGVSFLDYPHDRRTSIEINSQAMPYLKEEAIAAQSANVDIVSGATDSSRAFIQSLGSALVKAKN